MRIWSCCSPVISLAVYKRCQWIKTVYLSMTRSRAEATNCLRVHVSQNRIAGVFIYKSIVYLFEWDTNDEPEVGSGHVIKQRTWAFYCAATCARRSQCGIFLSLPYAGFPTSLPTAVFQKSVSLMRLPQNLRGSRITIVALVDERFI